MITRRAALALVGAGLAASALGAAQAAEPTKLTLISTVTRVPNLPMLVALKLLEREDQIVVTVKDVRAPEAAVAAVSDGQGEIGTGFAPFFPAVEKGARIAAVMELSRPEGVLMAKKQFRTVEELTGAKLGSHSPKASMQLQLESYLRQHPASKPTIVFMPEGSPARAQALLQGALDAAVFDLSSASLVQSKAPDAFHVLYDFTSAPLSNSFLIVNTEFARKRPDVVTKVVRRMVESYRRGLEDPKFWVREGGSYFKELAPDVLESQLRALAKIFDRDGGLSRLRGEGAATNIKFQVDGGLLTAPASKWKPEQFFMPEFLETAVRGAK